MHVENVTVSINKTQPIVVIKPTNTPLSIQFTVSITRLTERNRDGQVVTFVDLANSAQNFSFVNNTQFRDGSNNMMWEYAYNLVNRAKLNITVSFYFIIYLLCIIRIISFIINTLIKCKFIEFKDPSTEYTYLDKTSHFAANTLKLNFKVSTWPFRSIDNTLDIEMDTQVDSSSLCVSIQNNNEVNGYLKWLKISLNGVYVYLFTVIIIV